MTPLDPARAGELLAGVDGVRVLVVGDLMLDRYVSGRVDRVSPEAPVPVVLVEDERSALGGAGNVAANVTALGAACTVVGCVGDDVAGRELLALLEASRVDPSGVVRAPERPTTVKTRVHAGPQQIVRFDRELETDVDAEVEAALVEAVEARAAACDVLLLQSYDKGALTARVIRAALDAAERRGLPSVVDPKRRSFFEYRGATVFKPNRRELEEAVGEAPRPDDQGWMSETRALVGCRHLLVTLGERGMSLQTEDGRLVCLPTGAREVYDVSGAGDTVSATVAVALAAGATVTESAALANHAAAVEVQRPGVRTVSPAEVVAHVATRTDRPPS